jgi:hypothetical protein
MMLGYSYSLQRFIVTYLICLLLLALLVAIQFGRRVNELRAENSALPTDLFLSKVKYKSKATLY